MSTVVIAAPISNKPTYVSGAAGRELQKIVKQKYPKFRVVFIPDNKCIHEYAGVLQKYKKDGTVLFEYYGHGSPKKVCGQVPPGCGKTGMIDPDNVSVLNDVICHATACWTSHTLGRLAEETGCLSYVGARSPLYVAYAISEHNYKKDVIDVWTTFALYMLDGSTVADSIGAMLDKSREHEAEYSRKTGEWLYSEYYARRFKKNRDILVPFGDLQATLF